MSLQSQRIQRLVRLREQQHLLTAVELRAARHMLHSEEEALASVSRQMQHARNDLHQAQQSGLVNDWLLACADTELCKAAAGRHNARRVTAQQAVDDAANLETAARTATKQMERNFEHARRTEVHAASRVEQLRLDEVAQNLRRFSRSSQSQGGLI